MILWWPLKGPLLYFWLMLSLDQIENKYVLKLLKNDYFFLENSENTLN
jgi:hypothetical protein